MKGYIPWEGQPKPVRYRRYSGTAWVARDEKGKVLISKGSFREIQDLVFEGKLPSCYVSEETRLSRTVEGE